MVIATKNNAQFVYDIKNILDKKIAIIKGHLPNILKNEYPNINLIEVNSIKEGLNKIINGECYAIIDNLATINYAIKKYYPNKLKINGMIKKNIDFSIATKKDELVLSFIINKIISSLDEDEKMRLFK